MKLGQNLSFGRLVLTGMGFFLCFQASVAAREGDVSKEIGGDIVAIYSDVCWHEEAGDLLGNRVVVVNSNGDYSVFYQEAEGVFTQPHMADAAIGNGRMEFSYFDNDGAGKQRLISFSGKITPAMISGSFRDAHSVLNEGKIYHLTRQPNKKAPTPLCK